MRATPLFMRFLIFLSFSYNYFNILPEKNVDIFGVNQLLLSLKM